MLQCQDCEFFRPDPGPLSARTAFPRLDQLMCDPFSTIKEPECLMKWQLLQLDLVAQSHQATLDMHRRLAPVQEKMIKHIEREIDEADQVDSWKDAGDDDNDEQDDDIFRV